ncbi:MAG: MCE family protein [Candidatus Aegiribacteria sp.]|nr:MCE family protein [Candidatus Aegiribacteria sp.]MBD3294420.1 MCE family protein [Candidatus Fermentibacteria bacterium]
MSMTGSKFRLGLFFSFGVVITVVLIFWLSGGFRESNNITYVSYFPWSVQGLNEGSAVMYNGVTIGHVSGIDIAPDGRLVEVLMKIRSDFEVDSTIVATMQLTGITGLRVINLSSEPDKDHTPRHYSFDVEYDRIPVGEGAIQTVTTTLTRITQIIHEVDFQSISDQFLQLLENTNAILASDKIERIEDAILSNSRNLDSLLITYTRLGRSLDRLVLRIETMAPELSSNMDSLLVELEALSQPLARLSHQLDDLMLESTNMITRLSSLLDILRSDPFELLIKTSGEGVWQ